MTDDEIKELMKAMQLIAVDGICYAHSFNIIKKLNDTAPEKRELIRQIKKSFADSATLCWTKIFGAYSEETHWGKLYGYQDGDRRINDDSRLIIANISDSYNYLNADGFRDRIFERNNLEKCEGNNQFYQDINALQENIKTYRDKYLSHTDVVAVANDEIKFPYIWPIYKTLTELSNILCDIDKRARFCLFPNSEIGQEYSIQRDNLKNRLATSMQSLFN